MSTQDVYTQAPGTISENYTLEEDDLEDLEELGVEIDASRLIDTRLSPVKSIKVNYTHHSTLGGHDSISIYAERYLGPDKEIAMCSGDDLKNWGEVRGKLQQLDRE